MSIKAHEPIGTIEFGPEFDAAAKRFLTARIAVYQCVALDSALRGHISGLAVGPDQTWKEPQPTLEGLNIAVSWSRYFIGYFDPKTRQLVKE